MGIPGTRTLAATLALLVPLLGLALYLQSGGSDNPDPQVQVALPAGPDLGASADEDVQRLRAHLERQPRDARAWVILARLQADTGRFEAAAQAYAKALAASAKVAADPAVWCEYADALGMAQGGSLSGKPREFIDRALALNPNHPKALEMAGSSEYAQGDYAAALGFWRPLLAAQQPGSQAHAELTAAIARTERLAATSLPAAQN